MNRRTAIAAIAWAPVAAVSEDNHGTELKPIVFKAEREDYCVYIEKIGAEGAEWAWRIVCGKDVMFLTYSEYASTREDALKAADRWMEELRR